MMEEEMVDVEMNLAQQQQPRANPKETIAKWMEKHTNGVLSGTHFKEYWSEWVPRIYSPSINENCLNWNFNEEEAQRVLFNPLEEFICNGDPTEVLNRLCRMDKPPSVCGHVFKLGEPTYSCRKCGMDSTCVLCVECFKKSEHRFHKYKMGLSGGGGCCDCGDIEAWKKAPFCGIHIAGILQGEDDEEKSGAAQGFPEDLAERTRIVFSAVLWYVYNLLTTESTAPPDIRIRNAVVDDLFTIDTFCTVLYNDESHIFEQVINTLTRVLKCNQRSAMEYVTNIDREGRAVVKCSSIQNCETIKNEIEKYTSRHGNKPLKVLVVHSHVVAHQVFALKLLNWLQTFLGHGEGFRQVFAQVALEPQQNTSCIIKGIMLQDTKLWKSARSHWHRLFISGMLLEYENKKALAKVFTKNYGSIIKDFIKDDHDHSYSICSLSVQLFTVPTIAHHLVAYEDALFIILNTFMSECSRKCNKEGKLEFERNVSSLSFKRAQYMLYDLRYILTNVPEEWNDDLRRYFLQGLSLMLNLLTMMQGMDAVTRQVGQHMEYEPEWESAFNLHIKLAYCISLAIKWCGSDRVVLAKAYRATLRKLYEHPCYDPNEGGQVRELADHSVTCIPYDVSSKPVSIHLPLSRFLAGLHLYLERHNLNFDGTEFPSAKPSPVQIIEPVLRTQVMIAQVHAGMWRRNGYALLNQLYFYHNVKCHTEMLDRDIQLLQIGASLIESNEFLIHLLNKYNLLNWAHGDFETSSSTSSSKPRGGEEDCMRQTIALVEEFLQLLISIIGERHITGISNATTEDRMKKEIVQHLCIKPLPHSKLNKTIPDDLTHETGLDDVIEEMATFKKPQGTASEGVYELKDEYYKDYDVFFYHYTREELSKSEEAQRKRRKAAGELDCCPPPSLPKVNESFNMLVDLLQCDVMLLLMETILTRCNDLKATSFSELQLYKILHLIGYALQEEESGNYPFFKFTDKAIKKRVPELLEQTLSCPRIESHKDLLKWTILKFKKVAGAAAVAVPSQTATGCNSDEMPAAPSAEQTEKQRRAKLAAQRRAQIMDQMAKMQNIFMKENAKLFEETVTEMNTNSNIADPSEAMDTTEKLKEEPVALGPQQTSRLVVEKTYTCILCQETQKLSLDEPVLVLAAFVHQATVLCYNRDEEAINHLFINDPLYLNSNLGPAPHTSTCGHVMHATCWQKYYDNVLLKEHRRPYRLRHPASFDVDKQEFLCPLCECLSNVVLPIIPPLSSIQPSYREENPATSFSFDDWLSAVNIVLKAEAEAKVDQGDEMSEDGEEGCSMSSKRQWTLTLAQASARLGDLGAKFLSLSGTPGLPASDENLMDMIQLFIQGPYTRGLDVNHHPTDKRLLAMTWKTLSYTIHVIETLLRDSGKPLLGNLSSRHRDCLESLIRVCGLLGSTWNDAASRVNDATSTSNDALQLLSILLHDKNFSSECLLPSILQWDSLGILVPLTFSILGIYKERRRTPIPTGNGPEIHILHLVFAAHIVKQLVVLKTDQLECAMETDEASDSNEQKPLTGIMKLLGKYVDGMNEDALWNYVKEASAPFLRCCVLFYHFLTDVPAPPQLTQVGGDTFEAMCSYLGTDPKEILKSRTLQPLLTIWCNHPEIREYLGGDASLVQLAFEKTTINRLVDLPHDYSELINAVSSFTCPNSDHEDSKNPTMCLVCGEILCSQTYCCQTELKNALVGACNYHAFKCSAGIGVFLRVRECEIMFLAVPMRGCFLTAPYLDAYGETDQGLRKGNPLKLCPERYKKLQNLWLSHSIHEEIARAIESSNNIMPIPWHTL